MQKSTYYDLNLVEGADVYNPLVNDVPNYETIDEAMHDNAVAGVTIATELASGNVHAITRSNPECAVIRFVATSDWRANDRMTIDGTEVTVRMTDGTVLKNNAYLINSNVLGILTGTLFTVYVAPFVPDSASDIRFDDDETVDNAIIKDREDISTLSIILSEHNKIIYANNDEYVTTINLQVDLSGCKGVMITYHDTDSVKILHSVFVPLNTSEKIGGFNSQFGSNIYRTVTVYETGLTISNSSASDYQAGFIVPRRIYIVR